MRKLPVLLIDLYRSLISPLFPPCCRFYPSCSQYAREAFVRYGCCRGAWLTLQRLLRCHPLHPGGFDPLS